MFAFRWVNRNNRQCFIFEINQKSAHQFIYQGGLPCPTCSRNSKNRRFRIGSQSTHLCQNLFRLICKIFSTRNESSNCRNIFLLNISYLTKHHITHRKITLLHQIIDHALKAHRSSIVRMINTRDAIALQFSYFLR